MSKPVRADLRESFRCALWGLRRTLRAERNIRIHLGTSVAVLVFSAWLRLTPIEWLLIIVAIALVFIAELFNTVAEQIVNLISTESSPLAKQAKDIAAGAVLIAALAATTIGLVVLGPRLWLRIGELLHRLRTSPLEGVIP